MGKQQTLSVGHVFKSRSELKVLKALVWRLHVRFPCSHVRKWVIPINIYIYSFVCYSDWGASSLWQCRRQYMHHGAKCQSIQSN